MTKSLLARHSALSDTQRQLQILSQAIPFGNEPHAFTTKLRESSLFPLTPTQIEIFQVNVGKMCNQVCKHCHVDAGPDRKEIMTRQTMQQCIDAANRSGAHTVDITGGAPEMNPDFRWFVEELSASGKKILVRCNLTIIVSNPKYHDLPEFFKAHNVEVVSSLPYFSAARTDSQRGEGVFERSIRALKMLNAVGYGMPGTGLTLNLVYNPSGAFLPADQAGLEHEFKQKLRKGWEIEFNNLFAITNLPVSRFLDYLIESGNYEGYMDKLIGAYNPAAAANVMCRNTVSVSWDGYLYDCDFNQMLDLKVDAPGSQHVSEWNTETLSQRSIVVNQHCFGCTAGAGSSCGGSVA
ncbi:MAG: arsenosugar biosynthesis radical SAM protein ArsS [Bacteroidia bacterium]|jgi:radical SAM/Cys-rich protein|nr:arsenosugar biosynthesis radical SAM protein ArsS [Bacteroidia bacterium]